MTDGTLAERFAAFSTALLGLRGKIPAERSTRA